MIGWAFAKLMQMLSNMDRAFVEDNEGPFDLWLDEHEHRKLGTGGHGLFPGFATQDGNAVSRARIG